MLHILHRCYTYCTGVTLELHCQSESSNFFMCIISSKTALFVSLYQRTIHLTSLTPDLQCEAPILFINSMSYSCFIFSFAYIYMVEYDFQSVLCSLCTLMFRAGVFYRVKTTRRSRVVLDLIKHVLRVF